MTCQATTSRAVNLSAINPKIGPQYSPNLYKWLKKKHPLWREKIRVFTGRYDSSIDKRTEYIGFIDDTSAFCGTQLYQVLSHGVRKESFAYLPGTVAQMDLREIPDFWDRYEVIGRCAIDEDHHVAFIGDETRWKETCDIRECQWCHNHTQYRKRWTETVHYEDWVSDPADPTTTTEIGRV